MIDSKPIICIDDKHKENTKHDRQNLTTPDSRKQEVDSLNMIAILQSQIRQADQLEDTNRITHSQRGIQVYSPGLNRIPRHLNDLSKDEEAIAYVVHRIAIQTQGPQTALNLETFTGKQLREKREQEVILGQVSNWMKG